MARVAKIAMAEEKIADFILMFGLVWFGFCLNWKVGIKRLKVEKIERRGM